MPSITLDLPEHLQKFLEQRAAELQYATPEDYLCQLVWNAEIEHNGEYYDREIQKGLDSGPPLNEEEFWGGLRERIDQRRAEGKLDRKKVMAVMQ